MTSELTPNISKIMIVEDEVLSALALEAYLSDKGYDVQVATCGSEALELSNSFTPDILISDWKLKEEIDGIEVARELLAKANPHMRIIFCSGLSIEEMKIKSDGLEVFRYMGKPCGLDDMLDVVKEAEACGRF